MLIAFKHVYKVVAEKCLEKWLIPKHSNYIVVMQKSPQQGFCGILPQIQPPKFEGFEYILTKPPPLSELDAL